MYRISISKDDRNLGYNEVHGSELGFKWAEAIAFCLAGNGDAHYRVSLSFYGTEETRTIAGAADARMKFYKGETLLYKNIDHDKTRVLCWTRTDYRNYEAVAMYLYCSERGCSDCSDFNSGWDCAGPCEAGTEEGDFKLII